MNNKISVCIATYNGEKYIQHQIESILRQSDCNLEIIVVDDCSNDGTINKIKEINRGNIKIYQNPSNMGYIKTFETALKYSKGDYIFLCDQDDIWPIGRVKAMIAAMDRSNKSVLIGNYELMTEADIPCPVKCKDDEFDEAIVINRFAEFIKIFLGLRQFPIYGSNMLINRIALKNILPFRNYKTSHDIWIFLVSLIDKDVEFYNKIVTYRRIHGDNVTNPNRTTSEKIFTRFHWILSLLKYFFEKK